MNAWLVTWRSASDKAAPQKKIVAILNSRLSEPRVQELLEFLYVSEFSTVSEKMAIALHSRDNPYPATGGGLIECGHNPWLQARRVEDLRVECTVGGMDRAVSWKERNGRLNRVELS